MPVCPKCRLYEFKVGDKYCGRCRNKLVTFILSPGFVGLQNPNRGGRQVSKSIKFSNGSDEDENKGGNNLTIELLHDPSNMETDSLVKLFIEDNPISLPYNLNIPPGKFQSIRIDADTEKLSHEDQKDITFNLCCKSNDPDSPEEFIKICIYSKLPIPVFLGVNSPHNPIEKIEFDRLAFIKDGNEISEKVFRLYNKGGGRLNISGSPQKPEWIKILEYPKKPLEEGSFATIRLALDTAKLPKRLETQEAHKGKIEFSFRELSENKTIPILIPLPPKAKIILKGTESNQDISQREIPCKKGRMLSYTLKVENLGGGELEVESWKFSKPVDWARFYGFKLESFGQEVKADEDEITLVIDTSRFKLRHAYPLNILVHTNASESPTCLALEFKCEKGGKLDTDNYIAIDFGTTNSSGAYSDLHDKKDRFKSFVFFNQANQKDENIIPSQMLFRDIDDPILGWRTGEEKTRILDKEPYKRIIWNLKRHIGSNVPREILGKKYHPEEIAEFIFRWVIDRVIDVQEYIPTRVVATCPAGFYHYQRASILRACRRASIRILLLNAGKEIIQHINESFGDEFPEEQAEEFKELFQRPFLKIDREKYEYEEDGSIGSLLIGLMIFTLENKYSILREEEPVSNTKLLKMIYKVTKYLLDYFAKYINKDNLGKDLPEEWMQVINKLEDLTEVILHNLGVIDIKILDESTAAAYSYIYILDKNNREQLDQWHKNETKKLYILVIDYGGGTTDISLVRLTLLDETDYELEVIATGGRDIGGEDIDKIIIEKYLTKLEKENKITNKDKKYLLINMLELKEALSRDFPIEEQDKAHANIYSSKDNLKMVAQNDLKIYLSRNPSEPKASGYFRVLPTLGEAISELYQLPRSEFNKMIQPEIGKIRLLVQEVLDEASHSSEGEQVRPHKIILVGKSSNIPQVKEALSKAFNWTDDLFDDTLREYKKACVALGAAYYGWSKREGGRFSGSHIIPYNIGYIRPGKDEFVLIDGLNKGNRIIEHCHAFVEFDFIPYKKKVVYIAQSESLNKGAINNPLLKFIGKYEFIVKEMDNNQEKVTLNFIFKESGLLEVIGSYRDDKKFLGLYYQFQTSTDKSLPYIFI